MFSSLIVVMVLALTAAVEPPPEGLKVRQVAPHAFVVQATGLWPANTLVVEMDNGELVMVGAPYTSEHTALLLDWLAARFGPRRLHAINPHFHMDGAGGNAVLRERGIDVWGSDLTARLLLERGERRRELTAAFHKPPQVAAAIRATPVSLPTRIFPLNEGAVFMVGMEAVEIVFPGPSHSPDLVVVRFPAKGLFYGGCALLAGPKAGNLSDADAVGWRHAMDRMAVLTSNMKVLIPGHGDRTDAGLVQNTRAALAKVDLKRTVAVTVDDLPWVGKRPQDLRVSLERLARHITQRGVPATGFVVGSRPGLAAVQAWKRAGLEVADHSFSHKAYSSMTSEQFRNDVLANHQVVRRVLGVNLDGSFFRYPFLDHGHTDEKVASMAAFMTQHHQSLAPVSLDTVDYLFADAYVATPQPNVAAALYVAHVQECAEHFEALSRELYGREIPLVLLAHANALNADHLGDVLDALAVRGYQFVTLRRALADSAYVAYGNQPPWVPLQGDRNFLNLVAVSRGLRVPDPSGERRFERHWQPQLEALQATPVQKVAPH